MKTEKHHKNKKRNNQSKNKFPIYKNTDLFKKKLELVVEFTEGSDTAEISFTRLRNQQKSNPKSRNHERNQ